MTHIENIPHILKYGITHKNSANSNPNFKAIGDSSLINTRNEKSVNITNGGNNIISTITLGDYIPFYFGVKMPMLYVIQHGGNFVPQATKAEDIVYIACSVIKINNLGYEFYFSDGHATDMLTTFYNKNKINDLNTIIDWNAIKSSYWGGENNLDIKRKKQAEFLIKEDVSPDTIIGYACYNDKAHKKLISFGIDKGLIKIKPNIYY
jgi:hypothetical protein